MMPLPQMGQQTSIQITTKVCSSHVHKVHQLPKCAQIIVSEYSSWYKEVKRKFDIRYPFFNNKTKLSPCANYSRHHVIHILTWTQRATCQPDDLAGIWQNIRRAP